MLSSEAVSAKMAFCIILIFMLCFSVAGASGMQTSIYIPAVAPNTADQIKGQFRVSAEGQILSEESVEPINPARPLLVIIDPVSFSGGRVKPWLPLLAKSIAERELRPQSVLVGIVILDGILRSAVTDMNDLGAEFDSVIQGYIPQERVAPTVSPGRFFDIVTNLISEAQEDQGDLDCLLLAEDSWLEDEEKDYILAGMERRLLSICQRQGTKLYGRLTGTGIWSELCSASGGTVFDVSLQPDDVIFSIMQDRELGILIGIPSSSVPVRVGRIPIIVETEGAAGEETRCRSMSSIWRGLDESFPSDYRSMRQALDWMNRSRDEEADQNLPLALSYLASSIREDPCNVDAYFQAGRVAAAAGDLVQSSNFLSQAILFSPPQEHVLSLYASVHAKQGQADLALETLQGLMASQNRSGGQLQMESARLLVLIDRMDEARSLYSELLALNPNDDRLRGEYGHVLWNLNERSFAREQFETALSLNPENVPAILGFSQLALANGDLESAAEWADRALRLAPQGEDVHLQIGRVQLARGDLESARSSLQTARTIAPQRHDILSLLVDVEVQSGRMREARNALAEAQALYPSSAGIYEKLAELDTISGNIDQAVAVLEAGAARSVGKSSNLFEKAAMMRERRGEYGQALLDYRAMLRAADPALAADLEEGISSHLDYLMLLLGGNTGNSGSPEAQKSRREEEVTAISSANEAVTERADGNRTHDGLFVPGGITLLAEIMGLDSSQLGGPGTAEFIFSYLLADMPSGSLKLSNHPLRKDLIAYLSNYEDLIQHLRKERLIPAEGNTSWELTLPLIGSKEEQSAARQFLSFFGVDYKIEESEIGQPEVTLGLSQTQRYSERQGLLKNMGVNLLDPEIREIRVTLRDDELPLNLGASVWIEKLIAKPKLARQDLLEQMILNPAAMQLYVTLEDCSEAASSALVSVSSPGELLSQVDKLQVLARFLNFQGDRITLPGSAQTWAEFLTGNVSENFADLLRVLLRRDNGRLLLLYALLGSASEPVQAHLTTSIKGLESIERALSEVLSRLNGGLEVARVWQDMARAFRLLEVDAQGLFINLDHRLVEYLLLPQGAGAAVGMSGSGLLRLNEDLLADLLEALGRTDGTRRIEIVEFLKYAWEDNPDMFTDASIPVIMKDPPMTAICLDLLWSLQLDSDLVVRYLEFCRKISELGDRDWNDNRTRTSQALFYLIGVLRQQGTISREEGVGLLKQLLDRLDNKPDESVFALQTAGFLSEQLLTLLEDKLGTGLDSSEMLWKGLAGRDRPVRFGLDGKQMTANASIYKMKRMKESVEQQQHASLTILLGIYDSLQNLGDDTSRAVLRELNLLQALEAQLENKKKIDDDVPHIDVASLIQKWKKLGGVNPSRQQAELQQLAMETAEVLHLELGVTLLTYCYAYVGAPENDVLVFDPHFVRKHDFYPDAGSRGKRWARASLINVNDLMSFIGGSLSGLGFELSRLETAQTAYSYGYDAGEILESTLLTSMRVVQRALRSDRAQEYVALCMGLGKEIITLSISENRLRDWSTRQSARWLSPRRQERLMRELEARSAAGAIGIFSPSELFLFGQRYLAAQETRIEALPSSDVSSGTPVPYVDSDQEAVTIARGLPDRNGNNYAPTEAAPPAMTSPVLERLMEITPPAGSAAKRLFQEELDQYGALLRLRTGMNRLSVSVQDTYEQLDMSTRDSLLYERISDLKFRTAEMAYSMGIPAPLAEFLSEMSLRDIRPDPGQESPHTWRLMLDRICALTTDNVRNWFEELLNRGYVIQLSEESGQ